jgi:hypothetical protein
MITAESAGGNGKTPASHRTCHTQPTFNTAIAPFLKVEKCNSRGLDFILLNVSEKLNVVGFLYH